MNLYELRVVEGLDSHQALNEERLGKLHVYMKEGHHRERHVDATDELGGLGKIIVLDRRRYELTRVLRLQSYVSKRLGEYDTNAGTIEDVSIP